jgi:cytoskeletal protein RodZ
MESIKKLFTNKSFILGLVVVIFIVILSGFLYWYMSLETEETASTNTVQQNTTPTVEATVDDGVDDIDKELSSVPESDFADSELEDSQVGL